MTGQIVYVVMIGAHPQAAATTLEAAQADAVASETQFRTPEELRWDEHPDGWRLMIRTGGRGRFAWTQRWVAAVPQIGGAR